MTNRIRLFLSGDVMTGRGIDQVLPHPAGTSLYEPFVRDARDYVRLAELRRGKIRRPITWEYIWGDGLPELRQADRRIINLETAITRSDDPWPGKEIHYRMDPANIACLTAAGIDCCCLANNHVLDWGYSGLLETLRTLDAAGLAHCGAGRNIAEAAAPAVLDVPGKGRALVFSLGMPSSGVPHAWAADKDRPGVNFLDDLSEQTAGRIADQVGQVKQPGDVAVVSIHWGGNWGYDVSETETAFARRLIDGGVQIVHGHSSHHVKALEVYHDQLILYGCGDLLNDYEGIGGYRAYRSDLALMYFPTLDAQTGGLLDLRLVPMRVKHFRLNRASATDAHWLCNRLNQEAQMFGTRLQLDGETGTLAWAPPP